MDILAEAREAQAAAAPPKLTRAEVLARAREAKKQKAALAKAAAGPSAEVAVVAWPPSSSSDPAHDVRVGGEMIEAILRGPQSAFGASPLQALVHQLSTPAPRHAGLSPIVDELCRDPRTALTSMEAKAMKLDVPRTRLSKVLPQLACSALLADRAEHVSLLEVATRSTLKPLLFLDIASYDEAPWS